ncbi:cupredoxin family copper-binding protein [Mesorhizobium sp. M0019]|uniref:cupredoxin domain-containing protein n=1 Tax=Mesorhizobium sp. M0019 TaxID=2956845 RepID=UPI00333DD6D3
MIRSPSRVLVVSPVTFGLAAILIMVAMPLNAADLPMVKIENFAFTPAVLTVKQGTTVTFENDDDIPHLVVANDVSFRSKALDTGDTYAFTFTKVGDYAYFCGLHPHMQGRITVAP